MADPVWLLVMFDFPVTTANHRRAANRYRKKLVDEGYTRIQLSIYAKYLVNATGTRYQRAVVRAGIPVGGIVRMLTLTDQQWASTIRFEEHPDENIELAAEPKPTQLEIFDS